MNADLIETLPLPHRLALSYAPRRARTPVLALMALEARLSAVLRQKGEAIIAQMKLAWWRDRFGEPAEQWPRGEPLLELLREWPGNREVLSGLVDGWEVLLGEQLDRRTIQEFASARAAAWAEAGNSAADTLVACQYALADLALHLEPGPEREDATALLAESRGRGFPACSRNLRPLAVLRALGLRALDRGNTELLDGPAAMLLALRVGITGR
ncbi:MAG: hypothetical protein JY451_13775 [Erythrobacter sp.]|nr:MAG: hypothetical protein JY451_13775 [Erythrobacter sp.]